MNEILVDQLCQDAYVDALTLGPVPGIMDGCDITIERADVLMQFAIGQNAQQYWLDREYKMRPGTRHVANVCGARFRNKQAGAQAIVDAALTGPATPRLEPITPIPNSGIGDPFLDLALGPGGNPTFGPFDVGDWPALLIGILGDETNGAKVTATYTLSNGQTASEALIINSNASNGLLVIPNLASQVTITIQTSGPLAYQLYVAPCALDRQSLPIESGFGNQPDVLAQIGTTAARQVIVANSSFSAFMCPHRGVGQLHLVLGAGGPYNVTIDALDQAGNPQTRLFTDLGIAAAGQVEQELALVASPMRLTITNLSATTAGSVFGGLMIKEF